jgi:hypothetical protein
MPSSGMNWSVKRRHSLTPINNTWSHNFAGPDFTALAPFGGAGGAYRVGICLRED